MAIPPIISNNPLLKLFRTDPASGSQDNETASVSQTSEDIVEISEAAQQRLDGIQEFSSERPEEIRQTAQESREILEGDEDLTLGADPAFNS